MLRLRRFQLEVASCCSEVRTMKIEPGTRFGRLTVVKEGPSQRKRATSVCRCDCGTLCVKVNVYLRSGGTRSCGCLLKYSGLKKRTHGATRTRLYRIYMQMMRRCYNRRHDAYQRYGAKGVVVCDEWRGHPSEFIRWARANGYRDDLTIDRIAGGTSPYSPDNCRWATVEQQANNRSSNHTLVHDGRRYTIAEAVRVFGVSRDRIKHRLKRGLPIEEVLDPRRRNRWTSNCKE